MIGKIKGKVKKVVDETREMLGKDGQTKVQRRIVNIALIDKDGDFVKVTSFDPKFPLPKEGEEWEIPSVKKWECFDGMVQNVMA